MAYRPSFVSSFHSPSPFTFWLGGVAVRFLLFPLWVYVTQKVHHYPSWSLGNIICSFPQWSLAESPGPHPLSSPPLRGKGEYSRRRTHSSCYTPLRGWLRFVGLTGRSSRGTRRSSFFGTSFPLTRSMHLFVMDHVQHLLDACAGSLEVLRLYPTDQYGEELLPKEKRKRTNSNSESIPSDRMVCWHFDLQRNKTLRTIEIPAKSILAGGDTILILSKPCSPSSHPPCPSMSLSSIWAGFRLGSVWSVTARLRLVNRRDDKELPASGGLKCSERRT